MDPWEGASFLRLAPKHQLLLWLPYSLRATWVQHLYHFASCYWKHVQPSFLPVLPHTTHFQLSLPCSQARDFLTFPTDIFPPASPPLWVCFHHFQPFLRHVHVGCCSHLPSTELDLGLMLSLIPSATPPPADLLSLMSLPSICKLSFWHHNFIRAIPSKDGKGRKLLQWPELIRVKGEKSHLPRAEDVCIVCYEQPLGRERFQFRHLCGTFFN